MNNLTRITWKTTHYSSFWTLNMFGGAQGSHRMGIPLPAVTSRRAVYPPAFSQKPSMISGKSKHGHRTPVSTDCQHGRRSGNTAKVKRFKKVRKRLHRIYAVASETARNVIRRCPLNTFAAVLNHRSRISGAAPSPLTSVHLWLRQEPATTRLPSQSTGEFHGSTHRRSVSDNRSNG